MSGSVLGTSSLHSGFPGLLLYAEETSTQAGHIPSQEPFLPDLKHVIWALNLNFLTHKVEGMLLPGAE